jgi:hypothetical protein
MSILFLTIQMRKKLVSLASFQIIFFLLMVLISIAGTDTARAKEKLTIGEVEDVILLTWGVRLPSRIDTGAATTSLDARDLKVTENVAEFRKLPYREVPGSPGLWPGSFTQSLSLTPRHRASIFFL